MVKLKNPHLKTPEYNVDPEILKCQVSRFEHSVRTGFRVLSFVLLLFELPFNVV